MALTAKDILDKEFDKKFKGYDPKEVDVFLDEVIRDYDAVIKERDALLAEKEELAAKYEEVKNKAEKLELAEERIMSTVLAAQRNAQMYISKVEVQAQGIMEGATKNAKSIIEGAQIKMENTRAELMKYEQLVCEYKSRFRAFLDEQYNIMDNKVEEVEITQSVAEISKYINKLTLDMADIDESAAKVSVDDILKDKKNAPAESKGDTISFKKADEIKILMDEISSKEDGDKDKDDK